MRRKINKTADALVGVLYRAAATGFIVMCVGLALWGLGLPDIGAMAGLITAWACASLAGVAVIVATLTDTREAV